MNAPERRAGDLFAPVTRVELDTALAPIHAELAALRADVTSLREHGATKADVEAMGRRIVMWVGGLLSVFVAVMGWLVGRT